MSDVLSPDKVRRICELNDGFRRTFCGGSLYLTSGVAALDPILKARVLEAVRAFDTFDNGDDPHGEHDMVFVEVDGIKYIWKVDYYDIDMRFASEDPADPSKTKRVAVIMLGSEY